MDEEEESHDDNDDVAVVLETTGQGKLNFNHATPTQNETVKALYYAVRGVS
jgi:hypothetical protein